MGNITCIEDGRVCRSFRGSAISEFGAAIFLLLVIILFPLINLIYLGAGYAASWYLNNLEVRELAVRNPAQAQTVLTEVDQTWASSGLARFVGAGLNDVTHPGGVLYDPSSSDPTDTQAFVKLTTQVTVKPFLHLALPLFQDIPGIGAPIKFAFVDRRPQEEKGRD